MLKKYIIALYISISILCFTFGMTEFAFSSDDLGSPEFTLEMSKLSPGGDTYNEGPQLNTETLLDKIVKFLMITIPTLAALFIVYGGIKMILAGGDTNEVQNGKKIITYNIIAIVVALLSYSIIQLIIWLIGAQKG